jgi:uncharacterized protein (TIGR03437 family)
MRTSCAVAVLAIGTVGAPQHLRSGRTAGLLYASTNQIDLVAPFGILSTGQVQVELRLNGTVLSSFDQPVSQQNPALFTSSGTGTGQLAALNQGIQPTSITSVTLPIRSKEWCRSTFGYRQTSPRNPTGSSWCSMGRLMP